MNLIISVDDNLKLEVEQIFDSEGLDLNTAINMFLKKVCKVGSIGFLFNNSDNSNNNNLHTQTLTQQVNNVEIDKMKKSIAKRLFENDGNVVYDNYVFSSENNSTHIFWANFHYKNLEHDLSLVLNDKTRKVIHLFNIPAKKFARQDFVMRADQPDVIDLQISYNDPTFTDNRSNNSFSPYLIKSLNY